MISHILVLVSICIVRIAELSAHGHFFRATYLILQMCYMHIWFIVEVVLSGSSMLYVATLCLLPK